MTLGCYDLIRHRRPRCRERLTVILLHLSRLRAATA